MAEYLNRKTYVSVTAEFDERGQIMPRALIWEDGRTFLIDRITGLRRDIALPAGGVGDRYRVRIAGRESYLYFEHGCRIAGRDTGRWFVERRTANL